jgi:hypothetical protein
MDWQVTTGSHRTDQMVVLDQCKIFTHDSTKSNLIVISPIHNTILDQIINIINNLLF